MRSALRPTTPRELHHRARFDAVRRRVFEEMDESSARWRLTWILPFHMLVLALLVLRGESTGRAALQGVAVGAIGIMFVARVLTRSPVIKTVGFFLGIACLFVLLATTGGLASPLLIASAMLMFAIAVVVLERPWWRVAGVAAFLCGYAVLALLWRADVGQLAPPLVGEGGHITVVYVTLALVASVFSMTGLYKMGCKMTRGYELAALELGERREELCTEEEGRSRALEGMAARLAHEVKNPLAAIKGLSTHMARNAGDPKTAERLAIVAAEADRLQSIVDGFLSFSRGLDDLQPAPVKPHQVARELGVLLETRAEEAGVKLEISGDADLLLDADARKLRQALLNLVLNAVQASPRGAAVRIAVARECEGARISVHDDGVGMTPEVLDRIRKPYFTTKEGGTGLGVAVARGLVEQHGGRLEIKSAAGKGTTAVITLPMKATPCAMLPNPLRALARDDRPSEPCSAEVDPSKPAAAGADAR
jgi:signal transduction histidine kinase